MDNKLMKIIIFLACLLIIIIGIFAFTYFKNTDSHILNKVGYSNSEVKVITRELDTKSINILKNRTYIKELINVIEKSEFNKDKLSDYLIYYDKYLSNGIILSEAMKIVNNNGNNLSYLDLKDVIDKDNFRVIISFMNESNYNKDNLSRYVDYFDKNSSLTYKEVINNVNSNKDIVIDMNTVKEADLSKGNLILVNKTHTLKSDYVPSDLVMVENDYGYGGNMIKKEAYEAFKKMHGEASKEGLTLFIASPYRSYKVQKDLFDYYKGRDGEAEAARYCALPGRSEHQTGLAIDLIPGYGKDLDEFGDTKEFTWMREHAHEYGFILRYPKEKENITGYIYESWHYRYLGVEMATKVRNSNLTYDEYYQLYLK